MVFSLGLFTAVSLALSASSGLVMGTVTTSLQSILRNTHKSTEYDYPTDITRDILPVSLTSLHYLSKTLGQLRRFQGSTNIPSFPSTLISRLSPSAAHSKIVITGEMSLFGLVCLAIQASQDHGLYSLTYVLGLSKGCTSTEADVWLYNGTLYVGHDQSALTKERTLENLYIKPILEVLERQNPESPFVNSPTKNGVWDTVPSQTLYFFIDVKTSGPETFKAVIKALEPLRKKDYLTKLEEGKKLTNGPVTVIGTGETPLDMVAPILDRDYFFDAPLASLNDSKFAHITGLISPIASTDFESAVGKLTVDTDPILSDDQLQALQGQIATAKMRGIGARYWNTPYFPIRRRNLVWRALINSGVTLLSVDDLDAVISEF
ncbi:hypothetical protein N7495_000983 [Penicillium taxi]|uniref:uncharacterized protein n=1 Tax=Penicillium taxi TaxID=168475 RepID=UPI00254546AB|nr:uncharacterized protein N7495_000983 [Penicillium taxi]KAJ5908301.1 hypothetical protein N7495_000983 [Penicillium taxi]